MTIVAPARIDAFWIAVCPKVWKSGSTAMEIERWSINSAFSFVYRALEKTLK